MYQINRKEKGGDCDSVSSEVNDATPVVDEEDEPSSTGGGICAGDTSEKSDADPEFALLKINDNTTAIDESGKN